MRERDYGAALGAGTALLLRLSKQWRGTGRIIIADSAFASVKSAVNLKKENGLFFLGLVKTASRKFPKAHLNSLEMERRGDHAVFTARESGVDLRAVTWNEGKKDKHGKIVKKNIVATCGTTLPAPPHFKRRWNTTTSTFQ